MLAAVSGAAAVVAEVGAHHKHTKHHKKHSKKKADGGASQAERPALQRRRSGTLSIDGHAAVKKAAAAASK